ncbi:MAG: hypothetical protein J5I93_12365 [Pirellulaceae bacterium]|nr:hypothetical protein [Pirellulaceae bacterium]
MNYFAHGRPFLDRPHLLAGTAVPDWLSVVDRKVRASSRGAQRLLEDPDPRTVELARGIIQHHADDRWFHQTRAFAELSLALTVRVRDLLDAEPGFRPSFLGHILVEILLDAALIAEQPGALDEYYRAMETVCPELVASVVERSAGRPAARLPEFIAVFCRERFLYDYGQDEKLLGRLNRVMLRVGLPVLPARFVDFLAEARQTVRDCRGQLLDRDLEGEK